MIIYGGTGNGYAAGVTNDNKLQVKAVTVSDEHYHNNDLGRAFHAVFNQSPTAADDCIFYIANDSDDRTMVIEGVDIGVKNCTADDEIYFEINTAGTTNAGTTLTPVNVNAESGHSAGVTCEYGADLDGGAATLTTGSEVYRMVLAGITDMTNKMFNMECDISIPYGKAFTIWIGGSATGTYYINLPFYKTIND